MLARKKSLAMDSDQSDGTVKKRRKLIDTSQIQNAKFDANLTNVTISGLAELETQNSHTTPELIIPKFEPINHDHPLPPTPKPADENETSVFSELSSLFAQPPEQTNHTSQS